MRRRQFEDKLNMAETPEEDKSSEKIGDIKSSSLAEDYEIARCTIRKAMKLTEDAIDIIMTQLRDDPSARMAEVLNQLLGEFSLSGKKLLESTKILTEIYKDAKKLEGEEEKTVTNVFQNAVIVGSLSDVLALAKKQKEEEKNGSVCTDKTPNMDSGTGTLLPENT